MGTLNVDKLDPESGTALEIGTSGDTITVPSGVGLTLTDSTLLLSTTVTATTEVKTNKISPATGVAFALGDSGDTFTVPSGATIVNSGTATGFGGGKIGQVINTIKTDTFTTTSGSFTDITGMTATITPSATSSKILWFYNCNGGAYNQYCWYKITYGDNSELTTQAIADASGSRPLFTSGIMYTGHNQRTKEGSMMGLDAPNTTDATTYKLRGWVTNSGNFNLNKTEGDADAADGEGRWTSSITLMEVLA